MTSKVLLCRLMAAALGGALLLCAPAHTVAASGGGPVPEFSGMVWERHGNWHLNGSSAALRLGESIAPGGLLTAQAEGSAPSIVILLPDGQRMLCECFEAKGCAQGFRVPPIVPQPRSAVWEMFVAVRNVLLLRPASAESALPFEAGRAAMAGNFEMVAGMSAQGEVSIAPGLQFLPAGRYSLSVSRERPQTGDSAVPRVQPLDWSAGGESAARVRIGGLGLYRIRVSDQAYVPRIEVEVLATSPANASAEADALKQTRETILSWSHTHVGWPVHAFLRVYLESR